MGEEGLMHQLVVLPFRGASAGWRKGGMRNLENQVQRREMPSPAPGEESSHAPVHTGGTLSAKQLCREGPEGPGGQQTEHEPAVCQLWQRWPAASWAALGRVFPAGQGRGSFPSAQHW